MKAKILQIAFLAIISLFANAQDKSEKKDNKVRIKVEKEVDEKKQIYERSFDATGMSQDEKNRMMEKIQDSILADNKGKNHKLKIEVEEGDNYSSSHFDDNYGDDNDDKDSDVIIRRKSSPRFEMNPDDFMKEFKLRMGDLEKGFKNFDFNFSEPQVFDFRESSSSKTIKELTVYPNRPKAETLNIKFHAPTKGNVLIKVMDTKGTVIAKDEVKDFSGEYVGQIDIPKSEGVVFVMVTQGEDGIVKRVQLGNKE